VLDRLRADGYDILARNHAEAILATDFPGELAEVIETLADFRIDVTELIGGGGGEAGPTRRLRRALAARGWIKHNFTLEVRLDGRPRQALSHEIDHLRRVAAGTIALEIEWNNKDPFFDRDLENFQRFHAWSAISAGVIITRGASLPAALARRIRTRLERDGLADQAGLAVYGIEERTRRQRESVARVMAAGAGFAEAFTASFVADKFGPATTHWDKLALRVARGVGNPCPLLLIGLPEGVLTG